MATYPIIFGSNVSYKDHILYNRYVADISEGIKLASFASNLSHEASAKHIADTINQNSEFITNTLSKNFSTLSNQLGQGFEEIKYGLDNVKEGIYSLQSSFEMAMGQVVIQFEMLRSELNAGFDRIVNVLENSRKISANEHFRDGIEFYNNGCKFTDKPIWFKDALKHFSASIGEYERNPLAHFYLAHIYHYQPDFIDFEKSLEHYSLCYTYAEAEKSDYAIAAQAYFYAGWINAAVYNRYEEAIRLTLEAIRFDSKLSVAYYNLAKYYSLNNNIGNSLIYIKKAIFDFDLNYSIKASIDPDFNAIRQDLNMFLENLKIETKNNFDKELAAYHPSFERWDPEVVENWVKSKKIRIDPYYEEGTLISLTLGLGELKHLSQVVSWNEEIINNNYKRAKEALMVWKEYFNTHVPLKESINKMYSTINRAFLPQDIVAFIGEETIEKSFDMTKIDLVKSKISEATQLLEKKCFTSDRKVVDDLEGLWGEVSCVIGIYYHSLPDGINCIAFSPDGRYLITADEKEIVKWDLSDSNIDAIRISSIAHNSNVQEMNFNHKGTQILIKFFDWDEDAYEERLIDEKKFTYVAGYEFRYTKGESIKSLFSYDGQKIFTLINNQRLVSREIKTGKICAELFLGFNQSLTMAVDTFRVVVACTESGNLYWYNYDLVKIFENKFDGIINSIHFDYYYEFMYLIQNGKPLRWDLRSGNTDFIETGSFLEIKSFSISDKNRFMVTCDANNNVKVWNRDWKHIFTYQCPDQVRINKVVTNPNGLQFAAETENMGTWYDFWDLVWTNKEFIYKAEAELKDKIEKIKEEEELRIKEKRCLKCGEKIGFMLKLQGSKYCEKHQRLNR